MEPRGLDGLLLRMGILALMQLPEIMGLSGILDSRGGGRVTQTLFLMTESTLMWT